MWRSATPVNDYDNRPRAVCVVVLPPMVRSPRLPRLFVLVVDDHADTADMLEHTLVEAGAVPVMATSAQDGLHIASQIMPHVVVVDIAMPDRDGFWFIQEFQKRPGARAVPSIALSGAPLDLLQWNWKDAGFTRALLKPVTPDALCATIAEIVDEQAVVSALERPRLVVGDLVTTPAKAGWIGEVVEALRFQSDYVAVRWRTSSGMSLEPMEESVRYLVRVTSVT
jgi:CheY-like chemotaxis protein